MSAAARAARHRWAASSCLSPSTTRHAWRFVAAAARSRTRQSINFRNTLTGARVLVRIAGGTFGPRQIWLSTASSASDCSFVPPISVAEVIEGSISIFDAPPLPTTTKQCKNGGWKTYGVFKNQGDCVSFVFDPVFVPE